MSRQSKLASWQQLRSTKSTLVKDVNPIVVPEPSTPTPIVEIPNPEPTSEPVTFVPVENKPELKKFTKKSKESDGVEG